MTEAPPPPPQEPYGSTGGATPPPPPPTPSAPDYGAPTGQPYGAPTPAYGQPPAYGAPTGVPAGIAFASWGQRVQSALIDWFLPGLVAGIVAQIDQTLGWIVYIVALAWALYQAYQAGATGQSMGKKMAGTRLAREADGQNIGGGLGIGRYIIHIVDAIPCYVGFLWPLWDGKRQTFADKILKTVVVKV